jgi:hypothetical protein
MSSKKILAIDPGGLGGTTGIVVLDVKPDAVPEVIYAKAIPDNLPGFRAWCDDVNFDETYRDFLLVIEHFELRGTKADITPVYIEGVVRFYYPDAILQRPSLVFSNKLLNTADLSHFTADFGKDHHKDQISALKHALYYLLTNNHRATIETLCSTL